MRGLLAKKPIDASPVTRAALTPLHLMPPSSSSLTVFSFFADKSSGEMPPYPRSSFSRDGSVGEPELTFPNPSTWMLQSPILGFQIPCMPLCPAYTCSPFSTCTFFFLKQDNHKKLPLFSCNSFFFFIPASYDPKNLVHWPD